MEQGASGVQSSFGVPGSGETSFNNFLGPFSLTNWALVVERRGLVVVNILGTIATSVLGQRSSPGAET